MPSDHRDAVRLTQVQQELVMRKISGLSLYRPMLGEQEAFHKAISTYRILRGGNRSGKSVAGAAEVAHAATGSPLYDHAGNVIPDKYPRDRPLVIWAIGYDQRHIGATIYRVLFQQGLYDIIKDGSTGLWRAYDPTLESDRARASERFPSRPLIEKSQISSFAWEHKAGKVFNVCRLKNGNEIYAYSSKAEPKQGDKVDLIWIDEDVYDDNHINEWHARILDKNGKFIWTAWPHSTNIELAKLSESAFDEFGKPNPDISDFRIRQSDNPHISSHAKKIFLSLISEEEARSRDGGDFAQNLVSIYPNFSKLIHCCPAHLKDDDDKVDIVMRERNGMPPEDWTHYLAIDPGHSVCCVLVASVPPPSLGNSIVIWGEVYSKRESANQVAARVSSLWKNYHWESFVIDAHAGRQTPMGHGVGNTIKSQYSTAFQLHSLKSYQTGSSFRDGMDNIQAGIGLVRADMDIASSGRPRIRIVTANCPNLVIELTRYRKRLGRDEASDDPAPGQKDHACDAIRYLRGLSPVHVPRRHGPKNHSPAYQAFLDMCKRRSGSDVTRFGPFTPPPGA